MKQIGEAIISRIKDFGYMLLLLGILYILFGIYFALVSGLNDLADVSSCSVVKELYLDRMLNIAGAFAFVIIFMVILFTFLGIVKGIYKLIVPVQTRMKFWAWRFKKVDLIRNLIYDYFDRIPEWVVRSFFVLFLVAGIGYFFYLSFIKDLCLE